MKYGKTKNLRQEEDIQLHNRKQRKVYSKFKDKFYFSVNKNLDLKIWKQILSHACWMEWSECTSGVLLGQ